MVCQSIDFCKFEDLFLSSLDILMQGMIHRIPSIANAEIRQFVNGPESFTEDGGFLLGEVTEVINLGVHNIFS